MVKDHYIFHKKSIKILKSKKYKAWRGKNDEIGEYVLPECFHQDHYEKILKKIKDHEELLRGDKFDKNEVQMPGQQANTMMKEQDSKDQS